MKCRSVKPNPCEFFCRTTVRGPAQTTPSPDSGRALSLADEIPSLRPLACWTAATKTESKNDVNKKTLATKKKYIYKKKNTTMKRLKRFYGHWPISMATDTKKRLNCIELHSTEGDDSHAQKRLRSSTLPNSSPKAQLDWTKRPFSSSGHFY